MAASILFKEIKNQLAQIHYLIVRPVEIMLDNVICHCHICTIQ